MSDIPAMTTIAREVIELDGASTSAPWESHCGHVDAPGKHVFDAAQRIGFAPLTAYDRAACDRQCADAALIAHYRNNAPVLAKAWEEIPFDLIDVLAAHVQITQRDSPHNLPSVSASIVLDWLRGVGMDDVTPRLDLAAKLLASHDREVELTAESVALRARIAVLEAYPVPPTPEVLADVVTLADRAEYREFEEHESRAAFKAWVKAYTSATLKAEGGP